jgi:hypothetical protein
MLFPSYQWNPDQGTLHLILAADFGQGIQTPNGQTRDVTLTTIA